jgi:hypothetical protein
MCDICLNTGKIVKFGRIEVQCDKCHGNFISKINKNKVHHDNIEKDIVTVIRSRGRQKNVR